MKNIKINENAARLLLVEGRDSAEAMMRYLAQISAFIEQHDTTDDFATTEKLERCKSIAGRLRVWWSGPTAIGH